MWAKHLSSFLLNCKHALVFQIFILKRHLFKQNALLTSPVVLWKKERKLELILSIVYLLSRFHLNNSIFTGPTHTTSQITCSGCDFLSSFSSFVSANGRSRCVFPVHTDKRTTFSVSSFGWERACDDYRSRHRLISRCERLLHWRWCTSWTLRNWKLITLGQSRQESVWSTFKLLVKIVLQYAKNLASPSDNETYNGPLCLLKTENCTKLNCLSLSVQTLVFKYS